VKTNKWFQEWPGVALWVACAACLVVQVLLPGFVGIANNGDFGKVYGWLYLAPRGVETTFIYFQPDYVWSARNYWNSPYHSSESALAWLATRIAGATHEGAAFDIRWLGAIHAAFFLTAFGVLLAGLRGMGRLTLVASAIVPLVAFTDVCYTAFLNSFYMDAVALCALLLMAAAAVWMASGTPPRTAPFCVFVFAALLFATSKTQHAIWMWLPAALLIAWGVQWKARRWRVAAWSAAGLVLLAGTVMLLSTDPGYRGQALFNILFYRLGPDGVDLQPLGVKPEELRYRGMHSYVSGAPTNDGAWTEDFGRRTGFVRLLRWYAGHPRSTLGYLAATLKEGAPEMRQSNLGNFRAEDGRPPQTRTQRFAAWSNWRAGMSRRWPWHLPLWYVVFLLGCVASGSPLKWVAIGIATFGAGEFVAAALADCLDTGRHLFLFQAATDLTVCFAAAWLAQRMVQKMIRHTP
jgi:hypothetical protein